MKSIIYPAWFAFAGILVSAAPSGLPSRVEQALHPAVIQPAMPAVWASGGRQSGEPLFFVRDSASGRPRATLLFKPEKISVIRTAGGDATFPAGDFVVNGRTIEYVGGGELPTVAEGDLVVDEKTEHSIPHDKTGKRFLLFSEGDYFHRRQLLVDYTTKETWAGPVPSAQALPRFDQLIAERRPIVIALLGDSISVGANASAYTQTPPYQAPYIDLFAERVKAVTRGAVTVTNFSVGGKTSGWGLTRIEAVAATKPDVIVIAFGMNDASGKMPAAKFKANIQAMIDQARQTLPAVEFVLVAGMSANPDWEYAGIPFHAEYQRALLDLAAPGVIVCDVGSVWDYFEGQKGFLSMTGNGVNHPNDFGHRLYADCLSATLLKPR